jgi:peptidyl-prolyl cis-trans isomerase A (cyclophilin A)
MHLPSRTLLLVATILLLGVLPAGHAARADDANPDPQVRVSTNVGEFVIEVFADRAPLTAANFLRYVREGFYTNVLLHRVVPNFVIQGGGYDATTQKLKPVHESIVNESGNGLQNKRGTVGLARSAQPHSGNSQFYVNLVDNPDLDPVPTRWGYAVFGRVIEGMDVIDHIAETATGAVGPFKQDAPLKPVIIESMTIVPPATTTTPAPAVPKAPPAAADKAQSPK